MSDLLADLAGISGADLQLAALAYAAGMEDGFTVGFERAETEMAQRWAAAAGPVKRVLSMPSQGELLRRRRAA